jgi:cell division protein FtsQ
MKERRKISVRKILQLLLTITVATGCIVAMVSASSIEGEKVLKGHPIVHIKNDRKYQFIEQQKIMDLAIYSRNIDILNTPVSRLNLRDIEKAIKADPWVADAQVFVDIDRVMQIYVTQRVPVARIFRRDGTSYYMDSTLHTMPLSDSYTYYTVVVTNAPEMGNDSAGYALRKQIATLVGAIIVDSTGMFELMPVLGNQRILFGDTSGMHEKFSNLVAFYKNVLNRIGWDKYETLDVRFKGQVVASPSLPYKGPLDKAISKMNWITSIEVTEAQKMHEDSVRVAEARWAAMVATRAKAAERARQKAEGKNKGKSAVHGHPPRTALQHVGAKKTEIIKTAKPNSAIPKGKASQPNKHEVKKVGKGATTSIVKKAANAKPVSKTQVGKVEKKDAVTGHPASKATVKKVPTAKKEKKVKSGQKSAQGSEKKKGTTIKEKKAGGVKYTYPADKGH